MKVHIFSTLAALIAICFAGQSLFGQYAAGPGYGYPAPAVMPASHPGAVPTGFPSGPPSNRVPSGFPGQGGGAPLLGGMAPTGPFGAPAAFIPASAQPGPPSQVMPAAAGVAPDGKKGHAKKGHGKNGHGKGACCISGGYDRHLSFYGEFLMLRTRDAEVAFAVPIDGPITAPPVPRVEVGPVGVADMDFQPGFRAGLGANLNECQRITGEYTMFESGTTAHSIATGPFVLESLVQHPSVSSAGSDFLQAMAQYDISNDIVDIAFHQLFNYCSDYQLAWTMGLRYAQHEQTFSADFSGTGTENVSTDIDFYGAGVRGGLEFERYVGCQWLFYTNGYGALIPGEFRTSYLQSQSFDSRVVNTSWKSGRIVGNWDLEMGVGRVSKCGNYKLSAGYVYSAWTNVVQTDEWIQGVHNNNFIDMDSTMTYDGLVARFEARY